MASYIQKHSPSHYPIWFGLCALSPPPLSRNQNLQIRFPSPQPTSRTVLAPLVRTALTTDSMRNELRSRRVQGADSEESLLESTSTHKSSSGKAGGSVTSFASSLDMTASLRLCLYFTYLLMMHSFIGCSLIHSPPARMSFSTSSLLTK